LSKVWTRLTLGACLLVACLMGVGLKTWAQEGQDPVVHGYLFYSSTCPDCEQVRTEVVPQLYRKYGRQLELLAVDVVAEDNNYQWLLACEKQYGASGEATVPVVFIGDQYLSGVEPIQEQLPGLVEDLLARGGVDYPDVARPGSPLKPTARFVFFYSPSCAHCMRVEQEVFPAIQAKFGDQVQWNAYDISDETNYRALLYLGQLAGLPAERQGVVPVVFMGDDYSMYTLLIGDIEIPAYLEPAIEWFLGVGGVDQPKWFGQLLELAATPVVPPTPAATQQPTPAPSPSPEGTPTGVGPAATPEASLIHMAYFAEVGCSECDRVSIALEHLQDQFPNLVVHKFEIVADLSLNLCLAEELNVPEEQRHDAPAVFVGSDYLVGDDIQYDALVTMVSKYQESGASPRWEECRGDIELPPPPPWWAVIIPGLADGINPCAFATIIFFVSYLSIIKRRGRDIILVGIAFALAVFLSYLGFGMILREVFAGLIGLVGPILRPILNVITALLCLVLAVISLGDFVKARRGDVKDMALQLPHKLRMWINATIRSSMKSETLVTASFVSGVVVSFIELACTGQVYVPIIQGLSNPAYRMQSTLDLVVYCLAFIVPLIVVFILSYLGTSSKELTRFFDRYAAPVKLVMMLLFLGIGAWLIYDVLRVWGVLSPLFVTASF
jgi:cytochrome c biogenesis protein CcdA/glutaredoxin